MAQQSSLCFIFDTQTLVIQGAGIDYSIDLPFLLRQELLFKPEVADTFAEALAHRMPKDLPGEGPVRVQIPRDWGSILLDLPLDQVDEMHNPLSHLDWELNTNAPESSQNYLMDYISGPGHVWITAIRRPIEEFLGRVLANLGYLPKTFEIVDQRGRTWSFDPLRARMLEEELEKEQWKAPSMLPTVIKVVLLLVLGAFLLNYLVGQREQQIIVPLTGELRQIDPVESSSAPAAESVHKDAEQTSRKDHVVESHEIPGPAPATALQKVEKNEHSLVIQKPIQWQDVLQKLLAAEDQLPDYIYLDSHGLLVSGHADFAKLLAPIAVSVKHSSGTRRWVAFEQALEPGVDVSYGVNQKESALLSTLLGELSSSRDRILLERNSTGWQIRSNF